MVRLFDDFYQDGNSPDNDLSPDDFQSRMRNAGSRLLILLFFSAAIVVTFRRSIRQLTDGVHQGRSCIEPGLWKAYRSDVR